jgi:hypothetical protein
MSDGAQRPDWSYHRLDEPARGKRRTANKESVMSGTVASTPVSIVLVHGGFVDGSGWQGVYKILKKDGYKVSIVQNPTITLGDDVAFTKRAIAAQGGPSFWWAIPMEAL